MCIFNVFVKEDLHNIYKYYVYLYEFMNNNEYSVDINFKKSRL